MFPNIKSLRMYFNGQLKAAVDELFCAFEKTITEHSHLKQENDRLIAEHREKMSRVEEENVRLQRLLDLVLKPEIKIHRVEDLQQLTLSVSKEVRPEEDQDCNSCVGLKDQGTEPSPIKVEPEELWVISQGTEQLQGMDYNTDDTDDSADTDNVIPTTRGKCDYNKKPAHPSHLYGILTQQTGNKEQEDLPSTKIEPEQEQTENTSNRDFERTVLVDTNGSEFRESGENLVQMNSDEPPLKLRRTKAKAAQSSCGFIEVIKATELPRRKSTRHRDIHCVICARPFLTMASLVIHARNHTDFSRCGVCGRHFKSVDILKSHIHVHVARTPLFSCYICGMCFVEDEGKLLEEHIMKYHKQNFNRCLGCQKCFKTPHDLTIHMRSHTKTLAQD